MKHLLKFSLIFLLFVIFSPVRILYPQWEYDGVFPDPLNPLINQTGGIHGLALDPEGKIWAINYYAYDRDLIYVAADINQYIPVRAVYVFNPDGTQASFSPIKFVTINGVTDTLGGFTNANNMWEARTGRGMKMAPDGNIVVAMYDTYYKINYQTGEGMNKVTPVPGMTATAPAFSENGNMFTGPVIPGNIVKEFDENFNFLQDVINPSIGYSRAFEVSKDGLTLYWAGYTNNCVYKYTRPDIFSPFIDYSIILKGFATESFAWYPNSDVLWVSAGSGMDLPNQYPDTLTYYSFCTWYGYDVNYNTIVDSIKWETLIDPYFQRPRAIAFSSDGSAAYVGMFGNIYYDGIQKFTPPFPIKIVRPNGGEFFSIGFTDTIKWTSTINNVKLEYSTDTGSTWNIIENSVPAITGNYAWLVPNAPSVNSLVRISDATNDTVFDISDNVFTISNPPVITVSPDSFFYNLNVGDSIITQLTIDNSDGLGELVYQISDRLVAGGTSKEINKKYPMQRQTIVENLNWFGIDPDNFSKLNKESKIISEFPNQSDLNNSVMSLPLIVRDVIGDGGVADIKEVRGRIFNENIEIEYVFANGINITDSLIAVLYLDIDRNPLTGYNEPFYTHDLGVDYQIVYYPLYYGTEILVYEHSTGNSYTVPYTISSTTISYSIPLSILGYDDGEMDLLAVSGYTNLDALDWAPDTGHATLLKDINWLSENPISGIVPPGESMNIEITANTSGLIGGNYLAAIDVQSNDPVNPVVEIPFTLHLTGIPQIFVLPDSLNFCQTYIGYYNSLVLSIESTGTDLLSGNIHSSNSHFVMVDSVFELQVGEVKNVEVQFHPNDVGIVSAELTINSNASSIPITILLTGEGVIAPNILTNTSLLEFQANTGDTLRSNFMIYNTGGSDLIVYIYDQVSGSTGSDRLFGAGYNMIFEIDADNGQILNSFPTPVFTSYDATGLAFSGDYLFFTDPQYTSNIFVLNSDNGNLINYFPSNSTYCDGLAYIDPYLYARDGNNNSIKVLNPTNGNIVRVIYPQVYLYGGLDGGNNKLFASSYNTIYELNPQNGVVVNSFYANNTVSGIGFTGERLFTSVSWAGIDEYDPNTGSFIRNISSTGYAGLAGGGKRDAKWLSENPEDVTISAGDSLSISLLLVTPNEIGHYTADIVLESNDPDLSITQLQVVLDVVTGVEEENSLPIVYSLYNNYPNPFNPATTIKYDLPEQSYVTIKIYNIVGEEITTLLNEEQNAGRYQIQWNASELASGVYFYRIQAGQFSDTKKLILMK